ncbi:MAG: rhamnogalacturonan lyase [Oscillospiraceae bacterium]|nr:rhamnogalacturonan lyase [Oscillospiraceae bacterium]
MKKKITALVTALSLAVAALPIYHAAFADDVWLPNNIRVAEELDRGLVAMQTSSGIYLTWRLQADEDNVYGTGTTNTTFDVYRGSEKIAEDLDSTNYIDTSGTTSSEYKVVPHGESADSETAVKAFSSGDNYFDIDLTSYKPAAVSLPKTATFTNANGNSYLGFTDANGKEVSDYHNAEYEDVEYTINDASCGDLDGDGEYELVIKWDCNGKDNSQAGVTGNVYLDAYKLDGTRLWRIDLGENIRAGAHYTQFLVYDFDNDGYAEVTAKTAPGSKDGNGAYVTAASHVDEIKNVTNATNETSYITVSSGYVLEGDEYLTVFNGVTGAAEDTIYYPNQRVAASVWGDSYGNRCDRFTATVAYLDGSTPYAVYMRGYYMRQSGGSGERQAACAVSFDGETLSCDYSFDTYDVTSYSSKSTSASYDSNENYKGVNGYVSGNEKYVGEGNHNCTVADVDNDGKDEVLTGALCYGFNNNKLSVEWCTYLQHGDALHIGDYDPTHDGYEFFTVHEDGGGTNTLSGEEITLDYGASVIDPKDGTIMFHKSASKDTGRGMMADVGAGGYYQINGGSQVSAYIAEGGDTFTESDYSFSNNFRIFWDGDLYDELLDGTEITSWNKSTLAMKSIFTADGCTSINGTKANPSLTADLFGDWREEVIYPLDDNSGLRVYTTNIYTDYKMKSLMYDAVYRSGVAAEQTAYNQPPHIGYYVSSSSSQGSAEVEYAIAAQWDFEDDDTAFTNINTDRATLEVKDGSGSNTTKVLAITSSSDINSTYTDKIERAQLDFSEYVKGADNVKIEFDAADFSTITNTRINYLLIDSNARNISYGTDTSTGALYQIGNTGSSNGFKINGSIKTLPSNIPSWVHITVEADYSAKTLDYTVTSLDGNTTYFSAEDIDYYDTSCSEITGIEIMNWAASTTAYIDNIEVYVPETLIATPTPSPTPSPSPTPTVAPTATPEVTVTPEITSTPEVTVIPEETDAPEETTIPEETTAPEETDAPIEDKVEYDRESNAAVITSSGNITAATVIFASYSTDGRLTGIYVEENQEINIGENTIYSDKTFSDTDTVKVYVWDTLLNMKPLF